MVNLVADWKFREEKITPDRLARLITPISALSLLNLIIDESNNASFQWKRGSLEARGYHRAEFRVPCSTEACDTFFNGVSGIRAHYYRGIAEGEGFTRDLVTGLAEALINSAGEDIVAVGALLENVRASLIATSAKIWIDEDASNLDRKGVDAEALITIEVPHWVKAAKVASAAITSGHYIHPKGKENALLGVQVPKCNGIGVFGAWVHDKDGAEFLVPSKRNRARQIRVYGFS